MKGLRIAGGFAIILTLAGCAVQPMSFGDLFGGGSEAPPPATVDMEGSWTLAQPGAHSCVINFGGGPGIQAGPVEPGAGCPDQFFTARHWELSPDGKQLTLDDFQMNMLAQMTLANGGFKGSDNAGRLVTLSRSPASSASSAARS